MSYKTQGTTRKNRHLIGKFADSLVKRPGKFFATDAGMKRFGLNRLMKWGRAYNRLRFGARWKRHLEAYEKERDLLLAENSGSFQRGPKRAMQDGWLLDTSGSLPHLGELLEQSAEVIRDRGGKHHADIQYPFLRSLLFPGDLEKYPAFLDFIVSSDVLEPAMDHLGTIPMLSRTRPPGVRFMESNILLDPDSSLPPRDSQLYHIDFYDSPMVYVLVLLTDTTIQSGPWTFLPAAETEKLTKQTGYKGRGWGYRVPDEKIRPLIDPSKEIIFEGRRGAVLFIDSSQCFHFGSRNAVNPRYMMMYGLTSPCRRDFSMAFMKPFEYQTKPGDPRLRRMVLE